MIYVAVFDAYEGERIEAGSPLNGKVHNRSQSPETSASQLDSLQPLSHGL